MSPGLYVVLHAGDFAIPQVTWSSTSCRSKPACSNCTSPDHTADSCSSLVPRCINCRGMHASTSLDCHLYQKELSICTLQADLGISFLEARSRIEASSLLPRDPRRQTSPPSSSSDCSLLSAPALPLSSASEFPLLPSTTPSSKVWQMSYKFIRHFDMKKL